MKLEGKSKELVDRLQVSTDELNEVLREVRVNLERGDHHKTDSD
jgi:hypothetical protein